MEASMPAQADKNEMVLKIFRKEKIITIKRLTELLDSSNRTGQRRLQQWHTYTSYNKNGRYYVLPDLPKFDKNGLWKHKGIFFSKHGNLTQTITALVNNSQEGLTVSETSEFVGVTLSSFMVDRRKALPCRRDKVAGRFVYFASDEIIYNRQKEKRQKHDTNANLTELPSNAEAVIILVERIKRPKLSIENLCKRLNRKGHRIDQASVQSLFEYHGLKKKLRIQSSKTITTSAQQNDRKHSLR